MVSREEFEDFRADIRRNVSEIRAEVRHAGEALQAEGNRLDRAIRSNQDQNRTEIAGAVKMMERLRISELEAGMRMHRFHWSTFWVAVGPVVGGLVGSLILVWLRGIGA